MPLTEASFINQDGGSDDQLLIVFGPTLVVVIGHLPTDENTPEHTQSVHALIDTGAGESCIDNQIAQTLELPIVDICLIAGVGRVNDHPVYMAHVYIPALERYQYGRFAGVDLTSGGQPHSALLG